jgi:hypothetical protein
LFYFSIFSSFVEIDQNFDPCRYYEVASEELVVYREMEKNNIVGKLKNKTGLKVDQRHRQQIHLVEPLVGWVDLRGENQEVLCVLLDSVCLFVFYFDCSNLVNFSY